MEMLLGCRVRLASLVGLAALTALAIGSAPAAAQQVTAAQGSVTIDLGVLNQLGPTATPGYSPYVQQQTYPGYSQPVYSQPSYGQPA